MLSNGDAAGFLDRVRDLLSFLVPRFREEGKSYVSIGIGCTGGRHRSVALAEGTGKLAGGLRIPRNRPPPRHRRVTLARLRMRGKPAMRPFLTLADLDVEGRRVLLRSDHQRTDRRREGRRRLPAPSDACRPSSG